MEVLLFFFFFFQAQHLPARSYEPACGSLLSGVWFRFSFGEPAAVLELVRTFGDRDDPCV